MKEEKTEVMVMMCMQKAFDNANAAGVAPPKEAIMATAAAEQPQCAAWLHHLFAYVQGSGGNGELLRDLDAYTKAAARTNMAVARSDAPPLPRPHRYSPLQRRYLRGGWLWPAPTRDPPPRPRHSPLQR